MATTMSLATISDILYNLYIPGLQKYIDSEDFLTAQLEKSQRVENVGYNFYVKVQKSLSEGIAYSGGATTALPDPASVQLDEYSGVTKTIRARIRIFRELLDYTGDNRKAPINLIDAEMNGVQDALKCENERTVIADAGVTPIACIASATVTNESDTWVTATIDDGGGAALCGSRWPTRYLRNGMLIDILAANHAQVSGTSTESLEILEVVDGTTITIKCSTNAAADTLAGLLADGQLIYHQDGYNNETEGIKSLFGSTTNTLWGTTNRSTSGNAFLKPFVTRVSSTGLLEAGPATGTLRDWSILNLVEFLDHLVQINKAKLSDINLLCEKSVLNRYITMKQAAGMYVVENAVIDGWPFQTVMCEGVKMTAPPYMFSNAIAAVPMNKVTKYKCRDVDFVSEAGGTWNKVANYDAFEAYLVGTYQYGCENFKHGGMIYDLKGAYDN